MPARESSDYRRPPVEKTPAVRKTRRCRSGIGWRDLSAIGEEDTTMTTLHLIASRSSATFEGLAICTPDPPEIGDELAGFVCKPAPSREGAEEGVAVVATSRR